MRVLVVKLSSLGDVIQTLPVLHDIHQHFPQARIDWVVEEGFADVLRTVPSIDRVIPIAQRRWRKQPFSAASRQGWQDFWNTLHEVDYDLVIDFQGLIKSARVARGARLAPGGASVTYGNASDLCGYEWPVRWMLTRTVPMEKTIHAVARYRSLAARACGQSAADWLAQASTYPWPMQAASKPPVVVFAHGTTRPDNEWPMAHWASLGMRFIAQGCHVALPQASSTEQAWANDLAAQLGDACEVWPKLNLAQVQHRMAQACLVVGVDSGLSHLAVALQLPVVQIFSQPRVARAGPVGCAHQQAVGGTHVPSVDEVWHMQAQVMATAPARPLS